MRDRTKITEQDRVWMQDYFARLGEVMSKSVIDSGRLVPIDLSESEAHKECGRLGIDWGGYDSPQEALAAETDEYAIIEGLGFCQLADFETADPSEDWCTLTKNADGSYNFRASYYNGGAHWTEVVEDAVKELGSRDREGSARAKLKS